MHTDPDKKLASEKPIPRFFRVEFLVCIHQHGPLIATDRHFAAGKLRPHSRSSLASNTVNERGNSLSIAPIQFSWTEKGSSDRVVVATGCLDVAGEWGI